MSDHVESRLDALQRVLEMMTLCLGELDRLGMGVAAVRLEHVCLELREELDASLPGDGKTHGQVIGDGSGAAHERPPLDQPPEAMPKRP